MSKTYTPKKEQEVIEPLDDELSGDDGVEIEDDELADESGLGQSVPPDGDDDATLEETESAATTPATTTEVQATGAQIPTIPADREPTKQMQNLGGVWLDFVAGKYAVQMVRQIGVPTVTTKKVMQKQTRKVRAEDGTETATTAEVEVDVLNVEYTWDVDDNGTPLVEQLGDPYASITGGLRAQALLAKAYQKEGYTVSENIKAEYGVWYVKDLTGQKEGYRYFLHMIDCPPGMVKAKPERTEKAAKEPKPEKLPKAVKPVKEKKVKAASADPLKDIVHTHTSVVVPTVVDED